MICCNRFWGILTLLASIGGVGSVSADNWPQWRGPNNDGVSTAKNTPTTWNDSTNIIWKVKLPGMGGATPIIWEDRIFVLSEDGKDIVLLCISTEGKELWRRLVSKGGGGGRARGDEGNPASPTPSTDGKHVWVFSGLGDFKCFTLDGQEVWHFNAQKRYGKFRIQFGMHSTPVLFRDRLYLQLIHSGGAWVIALDKATGKEIWKVKRESDGRDECEHSYASAMMWTNGKDAYLVVHGNDYATAHSLEDGSEIWRVGDLNPKTKYNPTLRFVASPLVTPELIVVPSAKSGPVVGLKPTAKGKVGIGSEYELWRMTKGTPDVPSPLSYDGLVYLCRENGTLICLDAKTGKEYYAQRTHDARYRASPVYADGKIYIVARDGTTTVVKAGKTFEKLATNRLKDEISASPAFAGGRLYLRGFNYLYAIGGSGGAE